MEKEDRNHRACRSSISMEPEFLVQWGNRKRLRCVRVKDPRKLSQKSNGLIRTRITSRIDRCFLATSDKEPSTRFSRNAEGTVLRSRSNENLKSFSPEKEDRYYTTRGSSGGGIVDENGKTLMDGNSGEDNKLHAWPKLYITLSNKEKEEDFLAMKGCKPLRGPRKEPKSSKKPAFGESRAWLTDMCQERYEVRRRRAPRRDQED